MKKNSILFTLLLLVLSLNNISAETVENNGLLFEINETTNEACVLPNDYNFSSVVIPSSISYNGNEYTVTKLANKCFANCYSLNKIELPYTIIELGDDCFSNCSNLHLNDLPPFLQRIGSFCFYMSGVGGNGIELPVTLNYLGSGAFAYSNLLSIKIPSSIPSINSHTFYYCTQLQRVYINKGVKQILGEAFAGCTSASKIYCYDSEPPVPETSFDFPIYASIYVPYGSIDKYKSTKGWSAYSNYDEIPPICERPVITYNNGAIELTSDNTSAEYHYSIISSDAKSEAVSTSGIIPLKSTYIIKAYASAEGYSDSEESYAILHWLPTSGSFQTDGIQTANLRAIVVQTIKGFINISGLDNNEKVDFYGVDGKTLGSAKSIDGSVSFSAQSGTIVVAKIGKESVKIAVE